MQSFYLSPENVASSHQNLLQNVCEMKLLSDN